MMSGRRQRITGRCGLCDRHRIHSLMMLHNTRIGHLFIYSSLVGEASAPSSLNFGVEPLQFHAGVFDAELPVDAALLGMGSEASQQAPKSATPILSLEVALVSPPR